MTAPGMKPAAKERPEKPLFDMGVGTALAGMVVPVDLLLDAVEDVAEGVELLVLAEEVGASLVELRIWQFPAELHS